MRSKLLLTDADIGIGFVGRMIPGKAPDVLLDAFALSLRGAFVRAKLIFIGSGPYVEPMREMATLLGLQDQVVFAGELNGLQAMSAFDIFVLPSLSESFSYVVLEAMAMGLPIISTNVGAVSELVQEGKNGFVVEKSAPKDMAVALQKLLRDPRLRNEMGEASRKLAAQFSLVRMAQQVEQVYRSTLSKSVPTTKTPA
jgi:glycosyltransferase involved in cell wall biosynthesis